MKEEKGISIFRREKLKFLIFLCRKVNLKQIIKLSEIFKIENFLRKIEREIQVIWNS